MTPDLDLQIQTAHVLASIFRSLAVIGALSFASVVRKILARQSCAPQDVKSDSLASDSGQNVRQER